MKNYIKKWSLILLTVFPFMACETVDFGDTNVNPNSPSTASTAALLSNAETFIPTIVSEVNSNLMVQYISEIPTLKIQDMSSLSGLMMHGILDL